MNWFRARAKQGAALALVALAIQFVVSFGHFHAGTANAAGRGFAVSPPACAQSGAPRQSVAVATAPVACAASPDQPDPNGHANDVCDICAVIALAGAMLDASPPVLLFVPAYNISLVIDEPALTRLDDRRALFEPRAPPAS